MFADRNTDLCVFGLFASRRRQTQNFNPIFIVLLAPVMSWLWTGLAKRGLEPSIPVKFAIALIGVGAGLPVPGVGFDLRECRTIHRSACGGSPAFT